MLSAQAIYKLAQDNGLRFAAHYKASRADDLTPPPPSELSVDFRGTGKAADVWFALVSQVTELPVRISGTRRVSGSGAIDGTLFPSYQARCKEANELRAAIGYDRIY